MKPATSCPDTVRLQRHLQGTLPEPEAAAVIGHLDTCESCQHTLEDLAVESDWLPRTARNVGREATAPMLPSPQPDHLGRLMHYELIAVLGRGGMGTVYRAFDEKLGRTVAIKVLSPLMASDSDARQRFVREARAAAAVHHENVVTIFAVEEAQGIPFLVMELVSGISLQERLNGEAPLELEDILRIGVQTANGLAAAHAQGLVHRDIKPANILLADDVRRVKLTDFGLARAADDFSLSQSGIVSGTPEYMAPEQARGESVDHRADLFSLGSVLYLLCTGRRPFRSGNPLATLKHVCEERPAPIRELNPGIPDWLVEIVDKLLAKDPRDRFESAAEAAELLGRRLAPGTQPSQPPSPPRRWQWIAAAAAIFALLVAAAEIVIRITDKDGKVTEIKVPDGAKVEVTQDGSVIASVPKAPGEVRRFVGHRGNVWCVAFTPDGKRVVSAGADSVVRVWNTETGKEVMRFEGHKNHVFAVAVSHDGRRILSGDGGFPSSPREETVWSVCLWELDTGKQVDRWEGAGRTVTSVAFSADSQRALFGNYGGSVTLWDLANRKELKQFDHGLGLWSVGFSPDGRKVVTAGAVDGGDTPVLRLWDLDQAAEIRQFKGHGRGGIWQAVFSPDGQRILSAGADRTFRLWDVETGSQLRLFPIHDSATSAAFTTDGRSILTGNYGHGKTVRWWDVETGDELQAFTDHTSGVQSVAISHDGRWGLSGSHDGTVRLWELPAVVAPKPARATTPARRAAPRVLVVLAAHGFWYNDFAVVRHELQRGKIRVVVASSTSSAAEPDKEVDRQQPGEPVTPDLLLSDARASDFDAIVFCGGNGIEEFLDDSPAAQSARRLIHEMLAAGGYVGAISHGPAVLAAAGVLKGKQATCFKYANFKYVNLLEAGGAQWVDEPVVVSDRIVTARGTHDAPAFTRALLEHLGKEQ